MNMAKLFWTGRAMIYKLKFRNIGMPSYLGKPILTANSQNITLGKKCRIYPGMRAELVDKDSFLSIGDNVSVGQNFHVVSFGDNLLIGNNVTISGNVMMTNCDHSFEEVGKHILEQPLKKRKTQIGNGCFIGYGAVLLAGTILGEQCIVGANSVVRGEFPDYSVIAGAPAKIIKQYDQDKRLWLKKSVL